MTAQYVSVLGAAPGIQYQGVQDNSIVSNMSAMGFPVIAGAFKRGALSLFTVNSTNIRARLGYDPTNPSYMVIQDMLDMGIPLVFVRRIRGPLTS